MRIQCLDCHAVGEWKRTYEGTGARCPRCRAKREQVRNALPKRQAYRQLRMFPPDGPCRRCGSTQDLTWDHDTPLSKGGTNEWANLVVLCRPCNSSKAAS